MGGAVGEDVGDGVGGIVVGKGDGPSVAASPKLPVL